MVDIRKIQEQVIFNSVKAASDDETAKRIVFGDNKTSASEDNPTWVKNTMKRMEIHFAHVQYLPLLINWIRILGANAPQGIAR